MYLAMSRVLGMLSVKFFVDISIHDHVRTKANLLVAFQCELQYGKPNWAKVCREYYGPVAYAHGG